MKNIKRFLLVDDDPGNNMICKMVIKNVYSNVEVIAFEVPEEGLKFIEKEYSDKHENISTVLLLDLNMPTISGWQFLEQYQKLADEIKKYFIIYILSSSIDERDKERAHNNPNVKDYFVKPLSIKLLNELINQ